MLKVLGDEDPAMRYSAVSLFCQPDNVFPAPTPEHTSPPQTLSRLLCSRRIRSQGQKRKLRFEKKKKMLRRKHCWCASLLLWIQLYHIFWMQLPCHFCMPRKNCSMDTGGQRKDYCRAGYACKSKGCCSCILAGGTSAASTSASLTAVNGCYSVDCFGV